MRNLIYLLVLFLAFKLTAQDNGFDTFLTNFTTAKLPLNGSLKTNKAVDVKEVKNFITKGKKAASLNLTNGLNFDYGFILKPTNGNNILVTIYSKNPEDAQANFYYLLIYNNAGELLDGRVVGGRVINITNGNAEISDMTFIIQNENSIDVSTRISVQNEDSRELQLREEIVEKLKVNDKGNLVEVE